jgi:hypothetical protein
MATSKLRRMARVMAVTGVLVLLTAFVFCVGDTIDYTVSAWGPNQYPAPTTPPVGAPHGVDGYPGDTLWLDSYSGALDLTPGTYTLGINTFDWTVDYTYGGTATDPEDWSNITHDITLTRTLTFAGGPSVTLSQDLLLENTWDNDYVTIDVGGSETVIVGSSSVEITPLAVSRFGATGLCGSAPWQQPGTNLYATFVVTPIEMLVIDGCSTGVLDLTLLDGSLMSAKIANCAANARNHGEFVKCIAQLTNEWMRAGYINGAEKGAMERCASRANLP